MREALIPRSVARDLASSYAVWVGTNDRAGLERLCRAVAQRHRHLAPPRRSANARRMPSQRLRGGAGDRRTCASGARGRAMPDGSLRPAVEDWLGAGAVVDALGGSCAPEAEAARAAFCAVAGVLPRALGESTSGRQLFGRGYGGDVDLASAWDVDDAVPMLRAGAYRRAVLRQARSAHLPASDVRRPPNQSPLRWSPPEKCA